MGASRLARIGAIAALWALALAAPARSDDAPAEAATLKAAYLRYIAEFTTWPESRFADRDAPIVIGVLGEDPSGVAAALERRIARKGLTAQGRPVALLQLDDGRALAKRLGDCHLLFVPVAQEERWRGLREGLREQPVVTVGDVAGFAEGEGMIEFVFDPREQRVNMHIDLIRVRGAGLRLSSRLLGLKQGVKIVRAPEEEV